MEGMDGGYIFSFLFFKLDSIPPFLAGLAILSSVSLFQLYISSPAGQYSGTNMGLSPYSNPSDAGILCMILVNTAMTISLMKQILRSILYHVIGIRVTSSVNQPQLLAAAAAAAECPNMDEFRSRTPTLRYDSVSCTTNHQECCVCLIEFEPQAEINRLSCGHVFHKSCLEKWFKYWNITCPLCRNHIT